MIRVLVAEDSATARQLLVSMLQSDPAVRVVGEARTGAEALALAERLRPDLVTMDVEMPEMDGLEATRLIMGRVPTPIIIVSARANGRAAELSLEATRAGALLVLPKPVAPSAAEFEGQRAQLVAMAKAMAQVKVVRRWERGDAGPRGARAGATEPRPAPAPSSGRAGPPVRLVAVGASTGGPAALRDILAELPAGFPVPIVVVQHIARGFVGALASWLGSATPLAVTVAADGEPARAGTVYLAPDDTHLGVRAGDGGELRLALARTAPVGSFRPSATHLFESAAGCAGAGTLAVILTGMGDDGVAGLRAVHRAGGRILAQDEQSSVIYGMPREAVRAGVVDAVVPLGELPARIAEVVA
jgi:two-component system chemotaxis response regulator CheB